LAASEFTLDKLQIVIKNGMVFCSVVTVSHHQRHRRRSAIQREAATGVQLFRGVFSCK
jgi:hypothetical protein